ncbi:membrane protein [Rhizocola hellebori]|uniref:Membrane protein n=1 Tax=Rhizocola hellebori TaxID=1392758 RepID=A0A8J3Q2Z1_9ACTN|nr:DUF4231 domain-containing protein [Rhizocola hellebori]GIH02438.1 membrane protein [Rhizocola hellebori]
MVTTPGQVGVGFSLSRVDLPERYRLASDYSMAAQRSTTRWSALQLALLGAGALVGGVDVQLDNGVHLGALAAAVSLTLAMFPAVWLALRNPQRAWYRGRAAAESLKTLAWKYAVRAAPFTDDTDADDRFAADVRALRSDLAEVMLDDDGTAITEPMRRLRAADLPVRRRAYLTDRIDAECDWYQGKAAFYARAARWWIVAAIGATLLGLGAGFLKAFGFVSYDGLGAASAIAAAATAWMQLKQYRPLAAAYALTCRELGAVRQQLTEVTGEQMWALAAASAEEAISREHTMWIARRESV